MQAAAFSSSYMITNRVNPAATWSESIYPATKGTMFYFMAPGGNNPNPSAYVQLNGVATGPMPSTFQSALEADVARAVQNGGPQVTLYIHGLGNYFSDACQELGTFGQNLAAQGYRGLLIGFSWPSYGEAASYEWYGSLPYSFPPTATKGTIRDNIHGSTMSLLNLLSMLAAVCMKQGATLNLMCHSEGNYMLMLAMYALSGNTDPTLAQLREVGPFLGQVLLVAADINTGALELPSGTPPLPGQGSWIARCSRAVTVYWSSNDEVLPSSEGWTNYHNPSFPKRLGLHGPDSFAIGALEPNAYGLDCSLVANQTVIRNNPKVPPGTLVHSCYFYIPQILLDMTQTLAGVPPSKVVNRASAGAPDNQAFRMMLSASDATGPFQPRGTRLPEAVPGE